MLCRQEGSLGSHWPCVTHFTGLSTYGLTATEREISAPPTLQTGAWCLVHFTLGCITGWMRLSPKQECQRNEDSRMYLCLMSVILCVSHCISFKSRRNEGECRCMTVMCGDYLEWFLEFHTVQRCPLNYGHCNCWS